MSASGAGLIGGLCEQCLRRTPPRVTSGQAVHSYDQTHRGPIWRYSMRNGHIVARNECPHRTANITVL